MNIFVVLESLICDVFNVLFKEMKNVNFFLVGLVVEVIGYVGLRKFLFVVIGDLVLVVLSIKSVKFFLEEVVMIGVGVEFSMVIIVMLFIVII